MQTRRFGKTGWTVSAIGFGAWQIGGSWGDVGETDALAALNAAIDAGVTLIDTADVYGDGRSEKIIARLRRERPEIKDRVKVLTKAGRRLNPHVAEGYTIDALEAFIDRSRANLEMETLDLVQLHCPPPEVYYTPALFEGLDGLVRAGKIRHYGVSVQKVEEGIKAIGYPGVASVQIIFNILRQRPAELFFGLAKAADVAILARVPLASGLLTGKITRDTSFSADDHRQFNRNGEAFDVGETFAGVPFEVGLQAVEELRRILPDGVPMAQAALCWILMHDAVSAAIPGARSPEQSRGNAAAADLPPFSPAQMEALRDLYDRLIAPHVHHRW
jgi:aryl-alcohol dehydrogenase-like predicted oxidoreductase